MLSFFGGRSFFAILFTSITWLNRISLGIQVFINLSYRSLHWIFAKCFFICFHFSQFYRFLWAWICTLLLNNSIWFWAIGFLFLSINLPPFGRLWLFLVAFENLKNLFGSLILMLWHFWALWWWLLQNWLTISICYYRRSFILIDLIYSFF